MLCEVTTTKVHQWCGQIQCGQIQSGEIQLGEIGCGELKCDTIEIGELKLRCGAALNEFIALCPSLNSGVVVGGGTRSTRAGEEEKQWKPVCSSSSSSVPSRKLRAASFKGGFCLIHIIHPGFVNSITCVQHQIKTALGERRGRNQG